MKVVLVYPAIPPAPNSIGEHTVRLARAAAAHAEVSIASATSEPLPVPGVMLFEGLSSDDGGGRVRLRTSDLAADADWLVVQWNPNSWGRRGWCPAVVRQLTRIAAARSGPKVATVVHEIGQPPIGWRQGVMNTWQYAFLARLVVASRVVFVAADGMTGRLARFARRTPFVTLPVGSNIEVVEPRPSAAGARDLLGVPSDAFVIGLFGRAHPTRDQAAVSAAAAALAADGREVAILALGAGRGDGLAVPAEVTTCCPGHLAEADASVAFSAMDVFASPFTRGVSTRRSSFVAALAHGIPTVTSLGPETGERLRRASGSAFLASDSGDVAAFVAEVGRLADDAALREQVGLAGRRLHGELFEWPDIASLLLTALRTHGDAL